jgi:hypothetical protein
MRGACLIGTRFDNAMLHYIGFDRADVMWTSFRNADLYGAKLKHAICIDLAYYDKKTVLPDSMPTTSYPKGDLNGKPVYDKYWSPDVKMERYTNPVYISKDGKEKFWEPN